MKQALILITVLLAGSTGAAFANQVILKSNKAIPIGYKVAHQMKDSSKIVLSTKKSLGINKKGTPIKFSLDGYESAGIVVVSIDGIPLPSRAKRFGKPGACDAVTNQEQKSGLLSINHKDHLITCKAKA